MWQKHSLCADTNSATHPQTHGGRDPSVQHVAVFVPQPTEPHAQTQRNALTASSSIDGQLKARERFKTNTGHPGFLGTPGIWPRLLSKHLINLLTPQPHFLFFQATCLGLPNVITEKSQIYFYKLTCRSPEGSARGQEPRAPPCYANDPREPMLTAGWNIK